MKMTKRTGFTLVELLVVVALVGILAAIAILVINPAKIMGKTRDSQRKSDFKAIQGALELFYSQYHRYPTTDEMAFGSPLLFKEVAGTNYCTHTAVDWVAYMDKAPEDPLNNGAGWWGWHYTYVATDTSINICNSGQNPGYLLCSCVEDSSNDNSAKFSRNYLQMSCYQSCYNNSNGTSPKSGVAGAGYYGLTNPL